MAQISRILCPVDFTETSRHAIEHAVVIARWYKASVTALHVYTPPFVPVPGLPPPESRVPAAELTRVRTEADAWFDSARASGIVVDVLVDIGRPAPAILARAVSSHADLIVMGTHGAGGFERLLLGSVTERVLRQARCPVLTVPPHAQATSKLPFQRLLCAVDFSDSSLKALEFARSLASEAGAALILLHVVEWPWQEPPAPALHDLSADQASALDEFRRYQEKSALARLTALTPATGPGQDAAARVVNGKSYAEILRVAAEDGADLIVMGVHGRNAADVTLFGSTTNQVVRHATCPVLTLRL